MAFRVKHSCAYGVEKRGVCPSDLDPNEFRVSWLPFKCIGYPPKGTTPVPIASLGGFAWRPLRNRHSMHSEIRRLPSDKQKLPHRIPAKSEWTSYIFIQPS